MIALGSIMIAVILGLVEGATEFLPISSTGHLIVVSDLLGFTGDRANTTIAPSSWAWLATPSGPVTTSASR